MKLTTDQLTVKYGSHIAVDHISLNLGTGFHALLGPNGAGKSSLLRAIAGLTQPSSGSVYIDGRVNDPRSGLVGYLPQDNLEKSRFTVREHLAYMCWLRKVPQYKVSHEVDRLIELAGLADKADSLIKHLSGGMRRRVGISSALVSSPPVILLDEPTAGLDLSQRSACKRILHHSSKYSTVIISTHIVEDVIEDADTLTIMKNGVKEYSGPWEKFGAGRDINKLNTMYLDLLES